MWDEPPAYANRTPTQQIAAERIHAATGFMPAPVFERACDFTEEEDARFARRSHGAMGQTWSRKNKGEPQIEIANGTCEGAPEWLEAVLLHELIHSAGVYAHVEGEGHIMSPNAGAQLLTAQDLELLCAEVECQWFAPEAP